MNSRLPLQRLTFSLAAAAAFQSAHAADIHWGLAGTGAWATGTNWAGGVAPGTADRALLTNGGVVTIAAGEAFTASTLRFVNGGLTMTGGTLNTTHASDFLRIGDYGSIPQTPGATGTRVIGTATVNLSGNAAITSAIRVYIADGDNNGGTGTNVADRSTAVVNLSGTSSITANDQWFIVGRLGGTATVTLSDNAVLEKKGTANAFAIADGGVNTLTSGTVILNGSSAIKSSTEIYIGNGNGATGSLTVAGNSTVGKTGTGAFITVARGGNSVGTLTVQDDGRVSSNTNLRLAEGAAANATLLVKDRGVVEATANVQVGYQGTGKADFVGDSKLILGGVLEVGVASGKGTLLLKDNTIVTVNGTGTGIVGGGSGAQATVTLSDNSKLNAGGQKWKTGDFGSITNTGAASISLNAQSALTLKELTIGHLGGSEATTTVSVNGTASLTVNDFITIGRDDATTNGSLNAQLVLNGGTLETSSIRAGGGGTNAANNTVVANGGTISARAAEADFFKIGTGGTPAVALNTARPYVKIQSGGLTFDTKSFDVGIQTVLNADTASAGGGLTKTGAGKLTLSAANTYTGVTEIREGTLALSTTGLLTSSSAVVIHFGAVLDVTAQPAWSLAGGQTVSGSGTILGNVTSGGANAALSPGFSPGTLEISGNLDLTSGATFVMELGANSDLVEVTGSLTGSSSSGALTFNFSNSGGLTGGVPYDLLTFSSQTGLDYSDLAAGTLPGGYTLDPAYGTGGWLIGANSLSVQFIPEPGSATLLGLAVMGLLRRRQRRA